jgi:hypothetical protein
MTSIKLKGESLINSKSNKSGTFQFAASGTLLRAGLILVSRCPGHPCSGAVGPEPFIINLQIDGFQPDPSSPFEVKGDFIGTGVWQRLSGAILGAAFTTFLGPRGFSGPCQTVYTQDQILASDGSTLLAEVTGTRCETSTGAYWTIGVYSPLSGTGRVQAITGCTGPITMDARADGSTALFLAGIATGGGGHRQK